MMPCLEIADVRIAFACSPDLAQKFGRKFGPFVTSEPPDLILDVESRENPQVPKDGDPHTGRFENGVLELTYGTLLTVEVDIERGRGKLCYGLMPTDDTLVFPEGIYGGLSALYSMVLAQRGHALVHASGITRADHGILCPGISGTGKSTLSLMFEDQEVLNDELVGVTRSSRGWRMHSTPFWGTGRRPNRQASGPLTTVLLLAQGGKPDFFDVPLANRARQLMATITLPVSNTELNERVFETAFDMARLDWQGFEFTKEEGDVLEALERVLGYRP